MSGSAFSLKEIPLTKFVKGKVYKKVIIRYELSTYWIKAVYGDTLVGLVNLNDIRATRYRSRRSASFKNKKLAEHKLARQHKSLDTF